jgi:hypothetical protein
MMKRAETKYIHKCEELPEGDHLYALVDETYQTGDREDGYSSSPMLNIIYLGDRENAMLWLKEQEEARMRYSYNNNNKPYKIVSLKSLAVQRTVSLALE